MPELTLSQPQGAPHAEAQPRRGGGRAGKPCAGVDPFRRGRPGGARLCFRCPLVPAPRAPPVNTQAQPRKDPCPPPLRSHQGSPHSHSTRAEALERRLFGVRRWMWFLGSPTPSSPSQRLQTPFFPRPPHPEPQAEEAIRLNRHSPRYPPAPTPSQAGARAEVSPELSLQLEPNRRGRPRSTKGSVPKGHFWSDALSSEGFSPRK